jgi:hypothetical protein
MIPICVVLAWKTFVTSAYTYPSHIVCWIVSIHCIHLLLAPIVMSWIISACSIFASSYIVVWCWNYSWIFHCMGAMVRRRRAVSQPHFGQVWGWSPTLPKLGNLESSGTPKCLELDSKDQNTSHWGVLGVIEKFLKRKYRKWACIGHLDIASPSYEQKKSRESNWQFDSRPLKVTNRYLPNIRIESATRRWKDHDEGYNFGSDLVAIGLCSRELWAFKIPGLQPGHFRDNFGTPFRESQEFVPFGCNLHRELQRILYGGRWWLPPNSGRGESCVSKCSWLVPTPKGVPEC